MQKQKNDIFMQRRLYIEKHTQRRTYSALRYFYFNWEHFNGQTSKMVYLHQKRLNFIQEGQNERRYSSAGIKKAHLQWKIPKEAGAEL